MTFPFYLLLTLLIVNLFVIPKFLPVFMDVYMYRHLFDPHMNCGFIDYKWLLCSSHIDMENLLTTAEALGLAIPAGLLHVLKHHGTTRKGNAQTLYNKYIWGRENAIITSSFAIVFRALNFSF